MAWGPGFTIFKCDGLTGEVIGVPLKFVVVDYLPNLQEEYRDKIAVHEYGESLMLGHQGASILEWGVAEKEGIIARYLAWIYDNFPSKLADLDHCSSLFDIMPTEVYQSAKELADHNPERIIVLDLMKQFSFPPEAKKLTEGYRGITDELANNIRKLNLVGTKLVDRNPINGGFVAAYLFHKITEDILIQKLDRLVSTSKDIEHAWQDTKKEINSKHAKRTLNMQQAQSAKLIRDGDPDGSVKEELELYMLPFSLSLPETFAFAVEAAKLNQIELNEKQLENRLKKAMKIAKGTLKLGYNNAKNSEFTSIGLERFYIKVLLFDAIRTVIENGNGQSIYSKKFGDKFRKEVSELEEAFFERTNKKLFLGSEKNTWQDSVKISNLVKEHFGLGLTDNHKVAQFARTPDSQLGERRVRKIADI